MRATFFTLALVFLPLLARPTLSAAEPIEAERPPNILLIIGDDQAWTDYGFMGHPTIRTPRLDRLAEQSLLFPRAYVTTSLCRPSLATLITGLYPHQHGITGNDPAPPPDRKGGSFWKDPAYRALCEKLISFIERVPTVPRLLARKGYVSFQSGKWWEGHCSRGGFTDGMTHGDPGRGGRHGDAGLTIGRKGLDPVLEFIDGAGDKPFFVWYAPFLPHTPHNPPKRLLEKYTSPDRPTRLARYYAMCEWFDETCGALLDHLDKRKIAEQTLVLYIADNGWIQRTSETPVPEGWNQSFAPRSKQSPNEGGIRTPCLIRWPGRVSPGRSDFLVSNIDVAPTVLSACGVEPPEELPGVNLLDAAGGRLVDRDTIFGEIFAHDIADLDDPSETILYRWCIQGRWKLILTEDGKLGRYRAIHRRSDRSPRLYDLSDDPFEKRDLAGEHEDIVERLRRELDQWWKP